MNPRRRRHNRLTRKGTARFQTEAKQREERAVADRMAEIDRRLWLELKIRERIKEEFEKFRARRATVTLDQENAAIQKFVARVLAEFMQDLKDHKGDPIVTPIVEVRRDPENPTLLHVRTEYSA